MIYALNQVIAQKYFATLILDYEFTQKDIEFCIGFMPHVSCRVLIDGNFHSRFSAPDRAAAIEIFNSNDWRF